MYLVNYSRESIKWDFLFNLLFWAFKISEEFFIDPGRLGLVLGFHTALDFDFGQKLPELWPWEEMKLELPKCSKLICS